MNVTVVDVDSHSIVVDWMKMLMLRSNIQRRTDYLCYHSLRIVVVKGEVLAQAKSSVSIVKNKMKDVVPCFSCSPCDH